METKNPVALLFKWVEGVHWRFANPLELDGEDAGEGVQVGFPDRADREAGAEEAPREAVDDESELVCG